MLYGKNGSGKSTLGEALSMLGEKPTQTPATLPESADDVSDLGVAALFSTESGSSASLAPDCLVFNESFIERHVRLKRDGLETVVLLGEQVQVQDSLEDVRARHTAQGSVVDTAKSELDTATQHERDMFHALREALRAGWAQRQKTIRGNSSASPVGMDVVSRIINLAIPSSDSARDAEALSERITAFLSIGEAEPPARPWLGLLGRDYAAEVDASVLKATLEAPTGSGIAQRVGEALQSFASDVHRASELFSEEGRPTAPSVSRIRLLSISRSFWQQFQRRSMTKPKISVTSWTVQKCHLLSSTPL